MSARADPGLERRAARSGGGCRDRERGAGARDHGRLSASHAAPGEPILRGCPPPDAEMPLAAEREQVAGSRPFARAAEGLVLGTSGQPQRPARRPGGGDPHGRRARRAAGRAGERGGPRRAGWCTASSSPPPSSDCTSGVYGRFDTGAVVHTHSPVATALSCVLDEVPARALRDAGPRRSRCGWRPTRPSARRSWPAHVLDALEGKTAALMANHGALVHAADMAAAVDLRSAARVGLHGLLARGHAGYAAHARRRGAGRGAERRDRARLRRRAGGRAGRGARVRAIAMGVHVLDVLARPVDAIPEGQGGAAGGRDPRDGRRIGRRHGAGAGQARRGGAQRGGRGRRRAGGDARVPPAARRRGPVAARCRAPTFRPRPACFRSARTATGRPST